VVLADRLAVFSEKISDWIVQILAKRSGQT
jgi:hypothetical protein